MIFFRTLFWTIFRKRVLSTRPRLYSLTFMTRIFPTSRFSLASFGAEPGPQGRTPFLLAVHLGHLSVVQRLLSHGSTQLMEVAGTYGRAPVHEAAAMGNIEMLLGLLELNASVEQVDAQGREDIIEVFVQNIWMFPKIVGIIPF